MTKSNLKLVALLLFGTLGLLVFGIDLLDGEATLRRRHVSSLHTPVRYWLEIVGLFFGGVTLTFGWWVVFHEMKNDRHVPRRSAPMDDPARRRHF